MKMSPKDKAKMMKQKDMMMKKKEMEKMMKDKAPSKAKGGKKK